MFSSLHDLCAKVPPRAVNRATLESLVKSGAMDSLHGGDSRASMMAALESALKFGHREARDRERGQGSLVGAPETASEDASSDDVSPLPSIPGWSRLETLGYEREVLGFHVSGHPIDEYADLVRPFVSISVSDLELLRPGSPVIVAGLISQVRNITVNKGRSAGSRMAVIELQDRLGSIEAVIFAEAFAANGALVQPNSVVIASAQWMTWRATIDRTSLQARGRPELSDRAHRTGYPRRWGGRNRAEDPDVRWYPQTGRQRHDQPGGASRQGDDSSCPKREDHPHEDRPQGHSPNSGHQGPRRCSRWAGADPSLGPGSGKRRRAAKGPSNGRS